MPQSSSRSVRVGIDIGGTFTDLVLSRDGALYVNKTSTTPADPADAVIDGLTGLLARLGVDAADVAEVVHGTTVGSNTILQKTGALSGWYNSILAGLDLAPVVVVVER